MTNPCIARYLVTILVICLYTETLASEPDTINRERYRIQPSWVNPQGIPVFTNDSISKQQPANRADPQTIYSGLKRTCDFWSTQYRQFKSELARVNMNSACRDASHFAKQRLNKNVKAKYADYQPTKKNLSGKIVYNGSDTNANSKTCDKWRKAIKKINRQLRAGYKESKGNRLRQKRRELSDQIYRHC